MMRQVASSLANDKNFVGLDVGTTALKAVLVSVSTAGQVEVVRRSEHRYGEGGRPSRDPTEWVDMARDAIMDVTSDSGPPRAIGLTGQMHTLLGVDANGVPVPPVLLWLDMDGDALMHEFFRRSFHESPVTATGNIPLPDFLLAKWLYATHRDPAYRKHVRRLYTAKDFVRISLSVNSADAIDPNEAAGTQLYDPFKRRWNHELLEAAGLPQQLLPDVVPATEIRGVADALGPAWAETQVVVGVGDQSAAARAVGAVGEGHVSASLGTSGVVCAPWNINTAPDSWTGDFHLFPTGFDDTFHVIGTIPALGPTISWLAKLLECTHNEIDDLGRMSEPGSSGARFLPYLGGSGAPHPNHLAAAELGNMRLDFDRRDLVRAVLDGVAMELACIIDEMRSAGVPVTDVILSGGATRLESLTSTIASFAGVACHVVDADSASAVGAALLAHDSLTKSRGATLRKGPITPPAALTVPDSWRQRRREVLRVVTQKEPT